MTKDQILTLFRDAGALLEGHFILSSGRRSRVFLQKMFIFQDPTRTEQICKALATKITKEFGKVEKQPALWAQKPFSLNVKTVSSNCAEASKLPPTSEF
jgi:hypothetical protein